MEYNGVNPNKPQSPSKEPNCTLEDKVGLANSSLSMIAPIVGWL